MKTKYYAEGMEPEHFFQDAINTLQQFDTIDSIVIGIHGDHKEEGNIVFNSNYGNSVSAMGLVEYLKAALKKDMVDPNEGPSETES